MRACSDMEFISLFALVGSSLLASALIALLLDGRVVGVLGVFLLRWFGTLALFALNPFGYNGLSGTGAALIGAGIVLFTLFFATGRGHKHSRARSEPGIEIAQAGSAAEVELKRLLLLLVIAGSPLFLLYTASILGRYGFFALLDAPQSLRVAISNGDVPPGFYYLYFFELVAPVAVLLGRRLRARGLPIPTWLYSSAAAATLALLLTTARTNFAKAILFSLFVYLLSSRGRFSGKSVLVAAMIGFVLLSAFITIGNALGKSFENSALSRAPDPVPSWFEPYALPLHYTAAVVPTFDAVVNDRSLEYQYGRLTFDAPLSLAKRLVPSTPTSSHILGFYNVPQPFNAATQLEQMYRDFGAYGVFVISSLLGFLSGRASGRFSARPSDPFALLSVAWWMMIANSSTGGAAYSKISYLLQIGLIAWFGWRYRRSHSARELALVEE